MGIISEGFRHFLLMVGGSARLTFEDPIVQNCPTWVLHKKNYLGYFFRLFLTWGEF